MKSYYSKLAGLLTVLALLVAFSGIAMSQTETGTVVGTVTDPSGAVVPKAKVLLKSVSTGSERSSTTDDSGFYIFTNLVPAVYTVTVEASGFAKVERRVQVSVGSKVTQDVALTIGAAQQIVEITAEAGVAINTETQTLQTIVSSKQISELPTLTRNPYALVATSGNVSDADPSGRGAGYAINGMRAASTNILLDGAANNDEFGGTVGQSIPLDAVQEFSILTNNFTAEYGRASGGIVNLATKSGTNEYHGTVYEFNRVSKLASNEFDNNANGVARPTFVRNQFGYSVGGPVLPSLKDKLFFFSSTEWTRVRSSASRIRMIADPAFVAASNAATQSFFTAYGTTRPGLTTLQTFTKAGLIAAGFNPCVAGATTFPTCNALAGTTPMFDKVQYTVPADAGAGSPQNSYFMVGRVDYNMSSKTQVYFRYALESDDFLIGSNANSTYAGFDAGSKNFNNNALVSMTHTFTPRLVSQSKIVYNRLNNKQPLGAAPVGPTLYMQSNTAANILGTSIVFPGYLPLSPGSAIPFGGPQNFGQVYEDLSYSRGKHQLRFGGSYVYIQDNRAFGAYQEAVETLSTTNVQAGIERFLTGNLRAFQAAIDPQGKFPCRFRIIAGQPCGVDANADNLITGAEIDPTGTVTLPVGAPDFTRSNRYHEFAVYGQDSWRVLPRLTINLGLRWEFFGVQHNKNQNKDSNFYDAVGGSIFANIRNGDMATVPNSPIHALWKNDWNNFAPRLGFAWDVFGNGKTSLRGGYGVSYERNFGNVTFNVIQNPPAYTVVSLTAGVDVPTIAITANNAGPLAGVGVKAIPAASARNVDSNIRTAYAHTWSLSAEREVLKNLIVAVDYSGSKGSKLYTIENPNRPGSGNVYLGDSTASLTRLHTIQYTNINRRGGNGTSLYHAMNVRVELKNIHNTGLNLKTNYTWSHAIDNLSTTFSEAANNFNLGLLDPFDPHLDRGSADFDIRHRFVLSGTWDIPYAKNMKGVGYYLLNGWTLAPIFTARSGFPFSLFDCAAAFSTCMRAEALGVRPAKTGNVNVAGSTPNNFQYITWPNPTATAIQCPAGGSLYPTWNTFYDCQNSTAYFNPIVGISDFGPFPKTMLPRNYFRGVGVWNIDMGIYKTTKVTERFNIQFRAEMYNMVNHANFYATTSDNELGSVPYISGSKQGRRHVQLAVKLIF